MAIGDVKARIVRSDGKVLTLGDGDWRIPKDGLENWANLPYSVTASEIPVTDGAMVTSKRVSSVDRTIKAKAEGRDPERLRAQAIAFFNPKYSFEVFMTYMGRTRMCSGEQIGFKASEGNIYEKPTLTWTILCPDPYLTEADGLDVEMDTTNGRFGFPWYSLIDNIVEYHVGGFGFPWVSALPNQGVAEGAIFGKFGYKNQQLFGQLRGGAIFGVRELINKIDVYADGDVESGVKFTVRSSGGAIKNPTLRIGYAFARMLTTLKKNDVLHIDTTQLPPIVELNGHNATHLLDRNSNLLGLKILTSDTQVSYDAESGEDSMMVEFSYKNRYLGV